MSGPPPLPIPTPDAHPMIHLRRCPPSRALSFRWRLRLLIPLLVVGAMACENQAPEEVGGEADGDLVGAGWEEGEGWRVEEEFRLGVAEEEGPELFGEIRAIAVTAEGGILLFDGLANQLRRFTPDGEHEWTVGRAGEGPGEFLMVPGMALSPDGELWVVDARNSRYTVVGGDGGTRSVPRASRVAFPPWVGGFGPRGHLYDLATTQGPDGLVDHLLEVDSVGTVRGEHPIPRNQPPRPTLGGGILMALPFETRGLRAWEPAGGVWQAFSSEYRLTRIDLQGDTAAIAVRETEAIPFTPAERDSLAEMVRTAEQRGASVDPGMVAAAMPPLRWFTVDDAGRVWVCASGRDPCRDLDVLDRAGGYLGTVRLPTEILDEPRPVIRDGRFHATALGESGEPQLLVARIVIP